MKKLSYLLAIFGVFLFGGISVLANTCESSDFDKYEAEAENVNAQYLVKTITEEIEGREGDTLELTREVLELNIYNLTENLSARVINKEFDTINTYTFKHVNDGVIKIDILDVDFIQDLEIVLYPVDTKCSEEDLETIKITLPMFNPFSQELMCEDTPDFYLCQSFVFEEVTYNEFYEERERYLEDPSDNGGDSSGEDDGDGDTSNNSTLYIVVGVLVVGVVGCVIFVVLRRKKRIL